MKFATMTILAGALAFTACSQGPEEEFGREVNDPRIETTDRDNFSGSQQSGAANTTSPSTGAANSGGANAGMNRGTGTTSTPANTGGLQDTRSTSQPNTN